MTNYYTNLFSPDNYETFSRSARDVTGFTANSRGRAGNVHAGDRFVCYMTKLSRWVGILEVLSDCYTDDTPFFYPESDPYVTRFRVRPVVWLPLPRTLPIQVPHVWDTLSFTRGVATNSPAWTGKVRTSLNSLSIEDAQFLEAQLVAQESGGSEYPVDDDEFRRLAAQKVRRQDKFVPVTIPTEDDAEVLVAGAAETPEQAVRESARIQALLASIGEQMGFRVWIPKADRGPVLTEWTPTGAHS